MVAARRRSTRCLPRSFADSNGDGIGDLRGIIEHIDHFEYPGVDVIWLSSIYQSPHDDNGYDISDYQQIDPIFGDLEDFDELVSGRARPRHSHRHGPRRESHLGRACVVRGVRILTPQPEARLVLVARWHPGQRRREPPPEQLGLLFLGLSMGRVRATDQYYLHLFSPKQPDLNWENPEVRGPHLRDDALGSSIGAPMGSGWTSPTSSRSDPALPDGIVPAHGVLGEGGPFYVHGPRPSGVPPGDERSVVSADRPGTSPEGR